MLALRSLLIAFALTFIVASLYFYGPSQLPCNDVPGCLAIVHEDQLIDNAEDSVKPLPNVANKYEDGWADDQSDRLDGLETTPKPKENTIVVEEDTEESEEEKVENPENEDEGQDEDDIEDTVEEEDTAEEEETDEIYEEKYFTYIPHSDFASQKTALVNALLLSSYLNRTLIMPPVILGETEEWQPFREAIKYHTKNQKAAKKCTSYLSLDYLDPMFEDIPEECQSVAKLGYIPWDELFDLRELKKRVPYVNREEFDLMWLMNTMNLPSKDTYFWKEENSTYSYVIWDSSDPNISPNLAADPFNRYTSIVTVDQLKQRPECLLHLDSLHDGNRVQSSTRKHSQFRNWLDNQFVFTHPVLLQTANEAVDLLGGQQSFLSIYAHIGDSVTLEKSSIILDELYTEFSKKFPPFEELSIEPNIKNCIRSSRRRAGGDPQHHDFETFPIVYIGTDIKNPREDPRFEKLFSGWPCTLLLTEFYDMRTSPLVGLTYPPSGGNRLDRLMLPLIDGIVASQAQSFTSTHNSSFSQYFTKMNHMFLQGKIWVDGPLLPPSEDSEDYYSSDVGSKD